MTDKKTEKITYGAEEDLEPLDFLDILYRSGLAERRPVGNPITVKAMVEFADLMICARNEAGELVGVSRAVTDFSYCCYLSDLAVDKEYQGLGIGKELIRRTHSSAGGDSVTLTLLSAPAVMDYYPKAGLKKIDNCFAIIRD